MTCRPTCIQPSPSNAHCTVCHATFGGITGFDRHRRAGECLDPAALNMHADHRGVWRMDVAGDGPSARTGTATADENGSGVARVTPNAEWRWEQTPDGGWYSGPARKSEATR